MPTNVIFPKVSLEMATGRISRWVVEDGATVEVGQVLFEIDNDKAAVEVEAETAGVIRHLVGAESEIDVGDFVAKIFSKGETPEIEKVPVSSSTAPKSRLGNATDAPTELPVKQRSMPNPTPLARRIASERGLSLDNLSGTGPRGRIQKKDVVAELASLASAADLRGPPVENHRMTGQAAYVSTGQTRLNSAWLRQGKEMPVVMLHGFSGDLNNWRPMLSGGRSEWPALALDLPGHGRSSREIPDTLDEIAELVESTLAAEGVGPMLLAAHSFGGALATRLAKRSQLDIRGLCLFAPAGLGPEINDAFVKGILRAKKPESFRPWLNLLVHDPAVISEAFVAATLQQRNDESLISAMTCFADRFFPDGTQSVSTIHDLGKLVQPVRVIWGRQDHIIPFATTRSLPGNVALHAIDSCGHMPHVEKPELAIRILNEIWRSA